MFLAALLLSWTLAPEPACTSVAHIGDSTSVGMARGGVLRDLYVAAGASSVVIEVAGGRSLREHRPGRENGVMVARRLRASGFTGCWVIALGTNDAANVARGGGGAASMSSRVSAMMEVIGADPVLWVDAVTWVDSGHYALTNMLAWDDTLESALSTWTNANVYRWTGDARREWFQADGIHYTAAGSVARARLIVDSFAGM